MFFRILTRWQKCLFFTHVRNDYSVVSFASQLLNQLIWARPKKLLGSTDVHELTAANIWTCTRSVEAHLKQICNFTGLRLGLSVLNHLYLPAQQLYYI